MSPPVLALFQDDFPLPRLGYISSLEGYFTKKIRHLPRDTSRYENPKESGIGYRIPIATAWDPGFVPEIC